MHSGFVALILFSFVSFAFAQCQQECVEFGGLCASSPTVTRYCRYGTFCNYISGICERTLPLNSNCTYYQNNYIFDACADGTNCYRGACVTSRNPPGTLCISDSECYISNAGDAMSASSCVNGRCYGQVKDASCNGEYQCGAGLYCTGSLCKPLGVSGDNCTTQVQCQSTLYCNAATRTCTAYGTLPAGRNCTSTLMCMEGLVCTTDTKTCQVPLKTSSNNVCTKNADCGGKESCKCTGNGNTLQCRKIDPLPTGYFADLSAAQQCQANNYNCSQDFPYCTGDCYQKICNFFLDYQTADANTVGNNCTSSPQALADQANCRASSSISSSSSASPSSSSSSTASSVPSTSTGSSSAPSGSSTSSSSSSNSSSSSSSSSAPSSSGTSSPKSSSSSSSSSTLAPTQAPGDNGQSAAPSLSLSPLYLIGLFGLSSLVIAL